MRKFLLTAMLASSATLTACAHAPAKSAFTIKADETATMKAALCALAETGYTHDLEVDKELSTVSANRLPDVGSAGLDAEKINAMIQITPGKSGASTVRIVYTPGPGVLTTDSEKEEKIGLIKAAMFSCAFGEDVAAE
jgi:hypothetical protein